MLGPVLFLGFAPEALLRLVLTSHATNSLGQTVRSVESAQTNIASSPVRAFLGSTLTQVLVYSALFVLLPFTSCASA